MRSMLVAMAVAVALPSGACTPRFEQSARLLAAPPPVQAEPVLQRRRSYHDKQATRLAVEWQEWVQPGRPPVLHGVRTELHPDGTVAAERRFDHGEPAGRWRTWYADGNPRMEGDFSAPEATMRWWHPGGVLASQGPTRKGVRSGEWELFRRDGTLFARGTYEGGLRHGPWTYYDTSGQWSERGHYRNGTRTGVWERSDPKAAAEP